MKFERPKRFCCKKLGLVCLLLYMYEISYVRCQCQRSDSLPCLWENDPDSKIKWTTKTEQGIPIMEITNCPNKVCGIGTALSSWLDPSDSSREVTLEYNTYGYNAVYLKLSVQGETKSSDELFSINADFDQPRIKPWSTKSISIPQMSEKYRLILTANIPYNEAYVAVKGITLGTISENIDSDSDTRDVSYPSDITSPKDVSSPKESNDINTNPDKTGAIEEPRLKKGGFGPPDSSLVLRGLSLANLAVLLAVCHLFGSLMY